MMLLVFFGVVGGILAERVTYYDTFTGKSLTKQEYRQYVMDNTTFWCTGSYKPCDAREGRRLDETCNNLRYPYRGPSHTPFHRDLPPYFGKGNCPRRTMNGMKPEPARKERLGTLAEGSVPDPKFTAMTPHYLLFIYQGLVSNHDTVNYVRWNKRCCQPEGESDPMCCPMVISEDDTVHQFSGIKCMNFTKPLSYQSVGCIKDKSLDPQRINSANNFLDLSTIYGFNNEVRAMKDGLLQYEMENGKMWPVSVKATLCLLNVLPKETRCHKRFVMNGLMGTNFFSVTFWRLHNYIARQLKAVNPCWNDDKLFFTARDINIAVSTQVFYYELMADFMGKKNLLRDGVLVQDGGFRDNYDEEVLPQVSADFLYSGRWCHTIQPGMAKLYHPDGSYWKEIQSVNLTLRTGYYAVGNNMDGITQGAFRQPMGKIDQVVAPQMSETGLGYLQHAFDIPAADLKKGDLLGFPPYVHYRRFCTGKKYNSFEDIEAHGDINPEYIIILKEKYGNIEDIPLMVGIWLENKIPGGDAPRTVYCLNVKQMVRMTQYDRHWYERPNRPQAYTKDQLAEIRKATMAWIFCKVGDSVTSIQPRSFLLPGPKNQITSCSNIPQIDLSQWKDDSCKKKYKSQ